MENWDLFEQIKTFLPKYLTPQQKKELFQELKQFPENFNYFLSRGFEFDYLQGDCWKGFIVINFNTLQKKNVSGVIISNSCDIDPKNQSILNRNILFAPLIKLTNYVNLLKKNGLEDDKIESQLYAIKNQRITRLFYFPYHAQIEDESIIFLDDIHSIPLSYFHENDRHKQFTLSQYGFYLFLIKLSIHLSRFQENVQRFN